MQGRQTLSAITIKFQLLLRYMLKIKYLETEVDFHWNHLVGKTRETLIFKTDISKNGMELTKLKALSAPLRVVSNILVANLSTDIQYKL